VILNPPFVFGVSLYIDALSSLLISYIFRHSKPTIQEVTTPSTLNFSSLEFYNTIIARAESMKKLGNAWIDVRDLAEAHVRGLEREEAGGERIIVSAGEFLCSVLLLVVVVAVMWCLWMWLGSYFWQDWGTYSLFRR
jgi:nucleoside-diphosphate-sugar epimerase